MIKNISQLNRETCLKINRFYATLFKLNYFVYQNVVSVVSVVSVDLIRQSKFISL